MWTIELQHFENYLQDLRFHPGTIVKYARILKEYLYWSENNNIRKVTYQKLLEFIAYLKELGKSGDRINKHLLVVRHYLDMQVEKGILTENPAVGLQLKNVKSPVPCYLSQKTLQQLLESYTGKHRLLLSLVIHQGLSLSDLQVLQKSHLDFVKGTLYIPRSGKLRSRTLPLTASQILPLIKLTKRKKNYLFGPKSLNNVSYQLSRELKNIDPKVKNLVQIRSSVIAIWLETKNLREVQYLAGHGSINSTEKYLGQDLKNLTKSIVKYHPLR